MTPKEKNEIIARQGIKILLNDCAYTQSEVVQKCEILGIQTSESSVSNLVSGQRTVGKNAFRNLAGGISKILEREHCLVFKEDEKRFINKPDCIPMPVLVPEKKVFDNDEKHLNGYCIHTGRIDVPEKVLMYQKAKHEIIELGLRLRRFTDYFTSKREEAFLDPIRQKLSEGVNFKCYVLNPEGNFARRYFEDRAMVQPPEKTTFEQSPQIIKELETLCLQINKEGFEGKISLFRYDHFPYFHASAIDCDTENGMMYFASYLYGIPRANTPVIEVHQKAQKKLFKRYSDSIKAITNSKTVTRLV